MTLKEIELSGFKSFGKKSVVTFTTPVTAVVGPNGSGKSNIVEAIRFVLGEQSMKSLRGKGGIDLIFKGSKGMPSASRALVNITFDNSKKIFSFSNSGLGVSLDYDEITIGREVFSDGSNRYSINGTEVRLKDVNDLLASVNIGSSGHHIISQGEADRVLNASNKDRRAMIEDALGLKIYQFRIRESERKLERTLINVKEVQVLRREIAPHLQYLKKQVEVVERARSMREDLRDLYKTYLSNESTYIKDEHKNIRASLIEMEKELGHVEANIRDIESQKENKAKHDKEGKYDQEIRDKESRSSDLRSKKDELGRSIGRMEGIMESIEREIARSEDKKEKVISESEWREAIGELNDKIEQALMSDDMNSIKDILNAIKKRINNLTENNDHQEDSSLSKLKEEYKEMKEVRDGISAEIEKINKEEQTIIDEIKKLRDLEKDEESRLRDSERKLYEAIGERSELSSKIQALRFEEEKINLIKNSLELETAEATAIIGRDILEYVETKSELPVDRKAQEDLRRKIERIKIKLEDSGSGSGIDVLKEYKDTEERDAFLAREIADLGKSVEDIRLLIADLKETLDTEFKTGVEKINKQFQEFFILMFGGGSAFLSVVIEHKKTRGKKDEDMEDEDQDREEESEELGFERGIEINVTLPHKKVKDLHMLSGGERSLASIALLFAISQVNPPPFLVLDETDAALDEANSRKYGNMLENLSKYSELIVVTHNRETMSRASVLYGVTMDSAGASKLLSIRFEDASVYAK